ncbi:GNAT family N-acetyltransferase [Mycolicibacterium parafortuitum]|uniref:GCN5-like N-acetyltransferase [Cellulomonas fimi ATCC 484] n=1 Tax=Mycolicibacterium parafortuitum TaxID=39692 RepID=A0A375YPH8_MYCPF|nr:GNAT family N-acetyltransferase [Mycolicibacterium parafortuitum]ORB28473.1 GNAT family N-acetyltransferase [Mycolicibacterium parafortuitum]SRX82959.1 GCN5-like N-acetyltransferase [Cellulomonas fimi ATCC 484] [Mycolicibacterium parafortuitum]
MSLTDHRRRVDTWQLTPATSHDHPLIADFLATTDGLAGRKFAADSRDVAEQLSGAYPDAVTVVRDGTGRIRGYAALHQPHGLQPEIVADVVLDPDAPPNLADGVVEDLVARFRTESAAIPGSFLRTFIGDAQTPVIDALTRRGAVREGQFIRTRKPLGDEDPAALAAASRDGITVVRWPEVISRGLGEQVRRLQYDTFLEHFGNMSKTPEAWQHHIHSRLFAPDFSIAALDDRGDVVGYVLGSVYTAGTGTSEERSAHTDYIGVRADQRRSGIAELLLRKIWLAALSRGLTVASLGTDIHNRSNAHLLYARLGYVAVEFQSAYRIEGYPQ